MGSKRWAPIKKGGHGIKKDGHGLKRLGMGSKECARDSKWWAQDLNKVGPGCCGETLVFWVNRGEFTRSNGKDPCIKVKSLISFLMNMYKYLLVIPTSHSKGGHGICGDGV